MTGNSYPTMYNAGSYSKGHQVPNADRKSNDIANSQTYYVTNQTPQLDDKFNSSIWSSLETAVRNLTRNTDVVYVVTGAAFKKTGGNEQINYLTAASSSTNPQKLPIPNYYWKAVLKVKWDGSSISSASAIGFWFEHREYNSDTEKYTNFSVSVDQIEEWTGFDLFTNLPGDNLSGIEKAAESNTNWTTFQNF
jgi:endonuclease G